MDSVGASAVIPSQISSAPVGNPNNDMPSWYSTLLTQVGSPLPTSAMCSTSGDTVRADSAPPPPYPYPPVAMYPTPQFESSVPTQAGTQATTKFDKPFNCIEPVADDSVNLLVDAKAPSSDTAKAAKVDEVKTKEQLDAEKKAMKARIRPHNAQVATSVKTTLIFIGVAQLLLSVGALYGDILGKNVGAYFCGKYILGISDVVLFGISGALSCFVGLDRRQFVVPLFLLFSPNLAIALFLIMFGGIGMLVDSIGSDSRMETQMVSHGIKTGVGLVQFVLAIWQAVLLCKHYRPQNSCKEFCDRVNKAMDEATPGNA